MKRLTSILVVAALIIASCSQAKERPKIGLAMRSFDDPDSIAIRRSAETAAMDKADLTIIDGQNQQSAQDIQLDALFQKSVASIAIDPIDIGALGPIIDKAKSQRIPIVFFDRMPSEEAMRSWDKLFFVGFRSAGAGTAMGEILADYWKANTAAADKNKDGKVQYILLAEDPAAPDSALLAGSCEKALGAAGVKAERLSDGVPPVGKSQTEITASLIARLGEKIEAVVCADPASSLGAIQAFRNAGYFKGKKYMPIVGASPSDPSADMAQALSSGSLLGAAIGDASSQGDAVFALTYALAKGYAPSRAGWRITDAKYVWIPYKKLAGAPYSAQRK